MEELKNENKEEQMIEQRPSTKYGRTAYQQQLKEELEAKGEQVQEVPEAEEREQYQRTFGSFEETKVVLKNWYVPVLMVLIVISGIVAFLSNIMAAEAYEMANTLEEVMDAILVIASKPTYQMLVKISDGVFFATVIFLVLDILQLRRAGKSTKGVVLFAIFLRPAYFIWRAHVLGEKKAIPILYAVGVYAITIVELGIIMQGAMEMVMRTMY